MQLLCCVALLLLCSLPGEAYNDWNQQYVNHDRILLTSIQALTFHEGQMTTGRRSSPVPQLSCMGPNCRPEWIPSSVQCTNVGDDGYDVQWECKADLENAVRFGPVTVICEGYDNPEDPFVLRGSCQLEYSLKKTLSSPTPSGNNYMFEREYHYDSKENPLMSLFLFLIVAFCLYKCCLAPRQPHGAPGGVGGQGGYPGGGPPGYPPGGYPPNCSPPSPGYPQGGGGPGFWGGMATGGLLGYLGGRGRHNYGYNAYGGPRVGGYSSGGMMSSRPSSSSSSSGSRTASGFGGTRRR